MTVQTSNTGHPHLTVVADLAEASQAVQEGLAEVSRMVIRAAVGNPLDEQIPAGVLDRLAELDADHATACDVLDLATADLEAARKEQTEQRGGWPTRRSGGPGPASSWTRRTGPSSPPAKPPDAC